MPERGASFVHLFCRHAALWATRFLLEELSYISAEAIAVRNGTQRHLVYVLPHHAGVLMTKAFLQDGSNLDIDGSVRVMTYTDLNRALSKTLLPDFLRSTIIVLDSDFGRVPAQLVAASVELLHVWSRLKNQGEEFSGTAVLVSPYHKKLWPPEYIAHTFGCEVLHVELKPNPAIRPRVEEESDNQIAEKPGTIIVAAPFPDSLDSCMLPRKWSASTAFVLTPANFARQWEAILKAARRTTLVLFVDPSLRFLPPIEGPCYHFMAETIRRPEVDLDLDRVVEVEYVCSTADAILATSLGQRQLGSGPVDLRAVGSAGKASENAPKRLPAWAAWDHDMAETLLCLVSRLGEGWLTLATLPMLRR